MYEAHFGLKELPFSITPDTSFFFACPSHQEALNTLLVATQSGEGFIKVIGEVGTGKTLLCRKFLASLGGDYVYAHILNPYLEPRTLWLALADELEIKLDEDADQHNLLRALTLGLLGYARQGKKVVFCLDEAQAMPLDTLEALRLLTNLETEKRKLLQVVLFGQPELDEKLKLEAVRQINQRITFHYRLRPLNREEFDLYLSHRLQVAGYQGWRLFGKRATDYLYHASRGTPRLANILAHKSLLLAYGEGGREVAVRHARNAASDTPAANRVSRLWWLWAR